jgi:NAD(P)H dehydrogenase (quinone)
MKALIVYCHPNPASFNHALLEMAQQSLEEKGYEVRCRDLYALDFQPCLGATDFEAFQSGGIPEDIRAEQAEINWADRLIFIYPVWWTGLPARMKGYIDRVFSYGFAYDYQDGMPVGRLDGKDALIVNTTGSPSDLYEQKGMHDAIKNTSDAGIFEFSGLDVLDHLFFGAVPHVDNEVRKEYLDQLSISIDKLF